MTVGCPEPQGSRSREFFRIFRITYLLIGVSRSKFLPLQDLQKGLAT